MEQESLTPPLASGDVEANAKQESPENVTFQLKQEPPPPPTLARGSSELSSLPSISSDSPESGNFLGNATQESPKDVKPETKHESPTLPTSSPASSESKTVPGKHQFAQLSTNQDLSHGPELVQTLEKANMLATYGPASKRLLLFDYDGTLTDIVSNPHDALLMAPTRYELETLASNPKNTVWIISGRDRDFLEKEPGRVPNLGLVAEHGAFMRVPGDTEWIDVRGNVDMGWQNRVETVMRRYVADYGGSVIERKTASVVWHYRNANLSSDSPAEKLKVDLEKTLWPKDPVVVKRGKCIIEVRLELINKGYTAKRLAREHKPEFVLCAGDDVTDEDMFKALLYNSNLPLDTVFPVLVGKPASSTHAWWYVDEPADLICNIMTLIKCDHDADTSGGRMVNGKLRRSRP